MRLIWLLFFGALLVASSALAEDLEPNPCGGSDIDLGSGVYLQGNRSCGAGTVITTHDINSLTLSNYCPRFLGGCSDVAGWISFMTWTQPMLGTRPVVLMATADGKLKFCEHDGAQFICRYQIDIKTGEAGRIE